MPARSPAPKKPRALGREANAATRAAVAAVPAPWWQRPAITRVAGLWVLGGACAKAFTGTPAELPAPILALDLDPFLVIVAAVVVETVVAALAIIVPRIGWAPLAALLALFIGILALHLGSGAESCGCFGGALAVPAWLVLLIDAALLSGVLISRPWRWRGSRIGAPSHAAAACGAAALAGALALGWVADRRLDSLRPVDAPPPTSAVDPPAGAAVDPAPPAWRMPSAIPEQVILRPLQWVGKRLAETELGRWTDTSTWPSDATVIIYYKSCNHCAAYLRQLAEQQQASPASSPKYVLAQLPTPAGYTGRLFVDRVPEGTLVELPAAVKTWVITPPWSVFVKGGVVSGAERVKWSGEK
jgi:hypothetical protein